jgi:hypothetical protein
VPTINSSLGSKKFQGGMREFVVNEEDGSEEGVYPEQQSQMPPQPQYQQVAVPTQQQFVQRGEARRQASLDNSKISEAAKRRIETLCGMSRLLKEVEIGENIFVLRSLKTKENRDILTASLKYDGTIEFSFELRKQALARSLVSVAGVDIDSFLGTSEFTAKLEFIDELDEAVSDRLYNEYLNINKEIKDKYSFKTDQEARETVEDIKK